jgi:hypothetical protein
LDVLLLGLLGATTEEDDQFVTLLAEIDPVPWAEIYLIFRHTLSNGLYIREIPLFQTIERDGRLCGCLRVERREPPGKG